MSLNGRSNFTKSYFWSNLIHIDRDVKLVQLTATVSPFINL